MICDIEFKKINKLNNVDNINRVYKSNFFLLIINFNENLKIDYFKINIKLI